MKNCRTSIAVLTGWIMLVGLTAIAQETPRAGQLKADFLQTYPDADIDADGDLTPSEIWYVKSTRKKGNPQRLNQANKLMREISAVAPIDQAKQYGPAPGKPLKMFILSGQSNMVGQGLAAELSTEQWQGNDRILMFENGRWQPLRPLGVTFGPEIAFAHAMAEAWPDETIGIVKQSVGGTGVLAWHPQWTKEKADLTGDARKGNLWKALTDKVRDARTAADCEPMGFLWMQGGKDMNKVETGRQYLDNLSALVRGLRAETGVADLPFVLGTYRMSGLPDDLSGFDPGTVPSSRAGGLLVLKAQWEAQQVLAPAKAVPLRDLERHPENVHYNTAGQLELGRLFAEGYLELVGEE